MVQEGSTLRRSVEVTYTDPQGVQSVEDGLALAEEAFETWRAFLVANGLSAS
jgi:hypothetical protein